MRNETDAALLTSDRFQRKLAQAILDAMVAFLGAQADARGTSTHQ
jgi:N-acetylmuramoyl-L-alanine amidase